jgi:hypothetical protein
MRPSGYVTLAALCSAVFAGSCASPVDPVTGPNGEWLITQLSADHAAIGDSVTVTVTVYNATGHQLTLTYGSPVTTTQAQQGYTTFGPNGGPPLAPFTISLPPAGQVALRPIVVHIRAPADYTTPPTGEQSFSLSPGVYGLAGCVIAGGLTPEGSGWITTPGPLATFTVTQ